jgi:hypothetical protein
VSSEYPEKLTPATISSKMASYAQQSIPITKAKMDASLQEILTFLGEVEKFVQDSENLTRNEISTLKLMLQKLYNTQFIHGEGQWFSIKECKENLYCSKIASRVESIEAQLDAKAQA